MTEKIGNRVLVLWDREAGKFDARVGGRSGESFLLTGRGRIEFVVDVLGDLTRFVANTRLGIFLRHGPLDKTRKYRDGVITVERLVIPVNHALPVGSVAASTLLLK